MSDLDNLDGEEEVEEKERLRLRLEQLPAIEADTFCRSREKRGREWARRWEVKGSRGFFGAAPTPLPPHVLPPG